MISWDGGLPNQATLWDRTYFRRERRGQRQPYQTSGLRREWLWAHSWERGRDSRGRLLGTWWSRASWPTCWTDWQTPKPELCSWTLAWSELQIDKRPESFLTSNCGRERLARGIQTETQHERPTWVITRPNGTSLTDVLSIGCHISGTLWKISITNKKWE